MREPQHLPSGRWKIRFRYAGKQTSETFSTKREATHFAKVLDAIGPGGALDQLYAGEQQPDTVPSLDQVAADHIALLTDVTPGTRLNYERLWSRTWSPLIGFLPANLVRRDDLARAVIELSGRYSAKSLYNQRGLLAGVCSRAVELGHLPTNPTKGLRLPRGAEHERVEMRIIAPEEFAELAARFHPHYVPLLMFLYGTGARWGEAVALPVGDVNPPWCRIRRALKWSGDGNRQIGPTKTRKSNRTIALPQQVTDRLDLDRPGDELVFTAPRGGPVVHRTFWHDIWLPAVGDMRPRPRIHDLRHSHASVLLAAGRPVHEVSARLGHESIKTTADVYGHLMPDAQMASAQAASLAFAALPRARELG